MISSSLTLVLIVACPMKKTTAPMSSETTAIPPIHRSYWVVVIKLAIQGEIKITMTPTALAMSPTAEQR